MKHSDKTRDITDSPLSIEEKITLLSASGKAYLCGYLDRALADKRLPVQEQAESRKTVKDLV